jgi:hypothetical protein
MKFTKIVRYLQMKFSKYKQLLLWFLRKVSLERNFFYHFVYHASMILKILELFLWRIISFSLVNGFWPKFEKALLYMRQNLYLFWASFFLSQSKHSIIDLKIYHCFGTQYIVLIKYYCFNLERSAKWRDMSQNNILSFAKWSFFFLSSVESHSNNISSFSNRLSELSKNPKFKCINN